MIWHKEPSHRRFDARSLVLALSICALAVGCSTQATPLPQTAGTTALDARANQVFANSCNDCHSDQTGAQWNAKLAPSYLFGNSARPKLNFSQWQTYDAQKKTTLLRQIAEDVKDGHMPPDDYTLLHPSAKLTPDQKTTVAGWVAEQQTAIAAH